LGLPCTSTLNSTRLLYFFDGSKYLPSFLLSDTGLFSPYPRILIWVSLTPDFFKYLLTETALFSDSLSLYETVPTASVYPITAIREFGFLLRYTANESKLLFFLICID